MRKEKRCGVRKEVGRRWTDKRSMRKVPVSRGMRKERKDGEWKRDKDSREQERLGVGMR
jgi:hypothetical protein